MYNLAIVSAAFLLAAGCGQSPPTAKDIQAKRGEQLANQIQFSENAEQDNIVRRLKLTANPGQIGFVILLNSAGQPIWYGSVKGKITSSGKRLTSPEKDWGDSPTSTPLGTMGPAPSDEGTWGSSDTYVYFWTTDGQYMQWSGDYLYSDKPFRLKIEPLAFTSANPADAG